MHASYKNPGLRQLRDQQVKFAPRERRMEQIERAESLLGEIDPKRTYTYEYLCFRITDFRPHSFPDLKITGREAQHDLPLFVEDLSDSADIPVDTVGERVLSVEELGRMLNVSTKTISRWRRQGLVGRRFMVEGRKRVGFLQSSVDRFVNEHSERVERGGRFSQLTQADREQIILNARRLAREGGSTSDITKQLAKETGRSVETVRYTLRQFDREHPEAAVFPDHTGPLSDEGKEKIYQLYRRGTPVEALVKKYGRTKTSVYRIINEMRAARLIALPMECITNALFDEQGAEAIVMAPMPEAEEAPRKTRLPSGLPPYLASLYEVPLLNREQEMHLFRQFNYLKHHAAKLREGLDPAHARSVVMDEIERLYDAAVEVKNKIIRANLRLVVSIAKRHVGMADNFFELVSDGNMSLIRAVEKFDYARGNKFSTYASWAIMKNFARTIPDAHKQRDRFRTTQQEMFLAAEDQRTDQYEQESGQRLREFQVGRILDRLDEREQQIIKSRYGLDGRTEPLTLKEVGAEMGVTKERIRQIEARALDKLRKAAEEEKIDDPGE
jgi:RNA polymerase primary sigma factor